MNLDLLSAKASLAFMGIAGAAALGLLGLAAARRRPLLHLADAAAAMGLCYLFAASAFGWSLTAREALFALYAAIFSVAAAIVLKRGATGDVVGFPARAILLQQGAMAYLFAPVDVWRPLVSLLFMAYFLFEAAGWLRGSEASPAETGPKAYRPPLFPPPRLRGPREFALAGVAAAFVYVFAMGAGRPPVAAPEPARQEAAVEPAPAEAITEPAPAPVVAQTIGDKADVRPPAPVQSYRASAGETLKTIAGKLYHKPDAWRALAAANPGLKPGATLKAGQIVRLPAPSK